MSCHICDGEAVSRCYNCGQLVCAEHGKNDTCPSCNGGFMSGDPRGDRISVQPLPKDQNHGWWRPQEADEYQPPACYECKGLSRRRCRNCQANYCPDHAGFNGLCQACARSANVGLYIFAAMMGIVLLIFLFNWLFG
jgi:hypothetical protein